MPSVSESRIIIGRKCWDLRQDTLEGQPGVLEWSGQTCGLSALDGETVLIENDDADGTVMIITMTGGCVVFMKNVCRLDKNITLCVIKSFTFFCQNEKFL